MEKVDVIVDDSASLVGVNDNPPCFLRLNRSKLDSFLVQLVMAIVSFLFFKSCQK